MNELVARLGNTVKGVLKGFDRIVFKGTILPLVREEGAMDFLKARRILNRDYKRWMQAQSVALEQAVDAYARDHCGNAIKYLGTWRTEKEKLAKRQQSAAKIESGLIGAWSCLESGRSYQAHFSKQKGYPQLRRYRTQCKHLYLYFDHAQYGWMSVRLQTWFPYHIQIAMNGREWLRRRLEAADIDFLCQGNKFLHIDDYSRAQRFLDQQVKRRWVPLLNSFLPVAFPTMTEALGPHLSYYWTLWQSEWATDLIVEKPSDLNAVMDSLLRHAWITGNSTRVLRYMGRPVTAAGKPYAQSRNDVTSRVMDFHEGLRVRHWVDHNSIKMYNEHNNLRTEMTMNTPGMFNVYRRAQGEPDDAPKKRRPLRKGVAGIPLRTKVSEEINERFMKAVSSFEDHTPVRSLIAEHTQSRIKQGRRVRALDISGKDRELLQAISDPVFTVAGITNAALREKLHSTSWGTGRTDKQLSARITRHLRLLRDHGLIRKVPNRRRYQLTDKGTQLTSALNAMLAASTDQLMKIAA